MEVAIAAIVYVLLGCGAVGLSEVIRDKDASWVHILVGIVLWPFITAVAIGLYLADQGKERR